MEPALRATIERAIPENPVVLYMKGTRSQPQCGFSARVVEILEAAPRVRHGRRARRCERARGNQGIFVLADHPSALRARRVRGRRGHRRGAPRIRRARRKARRARATAEPHAHGERRRTRRAPRRDRVERRVHPPRREPRFEHDLCVGVPDPRDIVVEVGGLRISMPPASARRANGISIDSSPPRKARRSRSTTRTSPLA